MRVIYSNIDVHLQLLECPIRVARTLDELMRSCRGYAI